MKLFFEYLCQNIVPFHKNYPVFSHRHQGKSCKLILGHFSITLYILPSNILLGNDETENTITFSLLTLFHHLGIEHCHKQLDMTGDITFCQDFLQLMRLEKIHLEGFLFHLMPDTMALISFEVFSGLKHILKRSQSQLMALLKDYLTHQTGICADQKEYRPLLEDTFKLKALISNASQK